MSWKEKMKEFGGGDFTFLSEDGESIIFVVADEPVLIQTKYQGKPQERIGCPIVTLDGFILFIGGKRLARRLSKYEDKFATCAFKVTRQNVEGEVVPNYPVEVISDVSISQPLFDIKNREYSPELLVQAVKDAGIQLA